jgi:hypothetical protein
MIFGNEANYYYEIIHCDYKLLPKSKTNITRIWQSKNSRLHKFIQHLQIYSHYKVSIPNQFTAHLGITSLKF